MVIYLPESVIGQLLPANADEASRKALNVIFNVGRQALPGWRRLCLRQLRNEQSKLEAQTCTANSSLLCPLGLSNTLAKQASRLQDRLSRAVVSSGGRDFTKANPLDFSLQSKTSSEITRAVDRCFLFLEELGTHCSRYDLCFSAPFPARETNRQLQAAAFQSSLSGSDSILQMRKCAEIYFSQFVRPMQIECCAPWNGFRLVLVSKHIFQQCSSGPKSVDQVLQLMSVLCQNLPVWPRWKCWFVLRRCFFLHRRVPYNVGQVCRLLWATESCGGQIFNIAKI